MSPVSQTPFQWFGGKWEMQGWLAEHLPRGQALVITHGGAGSPLWGVDPYPVEVYNDLDGRVANFFRMCREQPEELATMVLLSPYHRGEYKNCRDGCRKPEEVIPKDEQLEQARRFAVVARQSMSGAWGRAWSSVIEHSRRKMASGNSRWLQLPETILEVAARLATVQIESMDAVEVIKRYDRPGTVFYLDPPYHPDTRSPDVYAVEMTAGEHTALLAVLQTIEGQAVLSGYAHPEYDAALQGWDRIEREVKCRSNVNSQGGTSSRPTRIEVLWCKRHSDEAARLF